MGSKIEKEECVKIANINMVRLLLHEERAKNVGLFPEIVGELNSLMNQFSQVES